MTTFTHTAIGYFIARGFATTGILPDVNSTYLLSMLFANAPDIDAMMINRRLYTHRENFYSLSHHPISWLILSLAAFGISFYLPPLFREYVIMAAIALFSHFLLDSFDIFDGIAWLGPFRKTKFSFVTLSLSLPLTNTEWSTLYRKHWLFYVECIICILAFAIAFVT